jgi:hypothetical protein
MDALASVGERGAIPRLIEELDDGDPDVRGAAALCLAAMGAKEAVPAVTELLEDADPSLVVTALAALGDLSAAEAIPSVRPLVRHPKPTVRKAAAQTLCRLGSRDGLAALLGRNGGGYGLWALNALRHPEAWRRLGPPPGLFGADASSRPKALADWAGRAGLALDYEAVRGHEYFSPKPSFLVGGRCGFRGPRTLEDFLWDLPFEAVVDEGRLRLLPAEKALEFWTRWRAEEVRKR